MSQLRVLSNVVVVIAAAMLLQNTDAAEYTVGDDKGWIDFPPGGDSFYSNWAENHTFQVNDVLVFNFQTGRQNVAIITTKHNFKKCKVSENTEAWETGPARVRLNFTGRYYFACTLPGHCSSGQKLTVEVKNESPSSSSTPAPSSSTAPGAKAHAHAHKGSATTLTAAIFPVLLFTVAFNVLFQ